MEVIYKRLYSADKQEVISLVQSRIDSKTRVCLTDSKINQAWLDDVIMRDETYNLDHRVFGAYVDGQLNMIFVLRLKQNYYIVSMIMSGKNSKTYIVNGYNTISAGILDYGVRQMESEGYTTFYSIIPDHPKWKRAEKNPAKQQLRYSIEEVLKIPANTMPENNHDFSVYDVISRPFNINMIIRRMTLL